MSVSIKKINKIGYNQLNYFPGDDILIDDRWYQRFSLIELDNVDQFIEIRNKMNIIDMIFWMLFRDTNQPQMKQVIENLSTMLIK